MGKLTPSQSWILITQQMKERICLLQLKKLSRNARILSLMEQQPCSIGNQPIGIRKQTITSMVPIQPSKRESNRNSGLSSCPAQQRSLAFLASLTFVAVSITFSMMTERTRPRAHPNFLSWCVPWMCPPMESSWKATFSHSRMLWCPATTFPCLLSSLYFD